MTTDAGKQENRRESDWTSSSFPSTTHNRMRKTPCKNATACHKSCRHHTNSTSKEPLPAASSLPERFSAMAVPAGPGARFALRVLRRCFALAGAARGPPRVSQGTSATPSPSSTTGSAGMTAREVLGLQWRTRPCS